MNHVVQKNRGYPSKRDILCIDATGNLDKLQQLSLGGLSFS